MEKYKIVNTEAADLNFIYFLFQEAINFQKKNNFIVWKGYDKKVLKKDIENKLQYKILINEEIACVFSICYSDPYIWREMENGDAVYIHRMVVSPGHHGKKHFDKVLNWVLTDAKQKKLKFVRMDTWAENRRIIEYYKSFGFKFLENYKTPDTSDLPLQHRKLDLALLELKLN